MFTESRLEPKVDIPSTRWHNLRERFKVLLKKEVIENVEMWYNTLAVRESRDSFQRCMKSVLNHNEHQSPTPHNTSLPAIGGGLTRRSRACEVNGASSDEISVAAHKAKHFSELYGAILSPEGKERVRHWTMTATESLLDDMRTSFSAIQATLNVKSVTKEHFVPKTIEEGQDKSWNRKRIDWMSKKVHSHMQNTVQNPMAGRRDNPLLEQPGEGNSVVRFTKPKSQFDGDAVMKSLGLDGDDALEKLREKREAAANAAVCTTGSDGCVVYHRAGKGVNASQSSSRSRIVATFNSNNTVGWQTTTRETIKDHSGSALAKRERVHPDNHPSMSRVTASLGMVLPHPSLQPK